MARKNVTSRQAMGDSLSNLAASLNGGKDKAANDAFFLADLPRDQIEAMYRGDWLARKIVDIVPYDSIREWREWAGDRAAVAAIERNERRLNLRKAVQRAMTLGRLYGGGAIIIGTGERDPASLAQPLDPEAVGPGGVRFLHVVSRWQLGATTFNLDPLDPYFGEPGGYTVVAPTRGQLTLHPSRVIRFLGNPLPDPLSFGFQLWSDSVLQTLYDAVHAVALTATGATSLIHEAKVDIVTVPNLSEHLANAATTAQLSARFAYAAAMKSINNLLLLGDGETWTRQNVDFAGLPEMIRTFLQMAAGAADIPVTRLLGQSPAGLSATGDSDTRNYYDMISARQELDLRPQLERLDAVLLRSAGVDPSSVSFEFRPLWQLNASERAQVALSKAQTTQIYAGLTLWPAAMTAGLVQSQLLEDGTYPNAEPLFAAVGAMGGEAPRPANDFNPGQLRDPDGQWAGGSGQASALPIVRVAHVHMEPMAGEPEDPNQEEEEEDENRLREMLPGVSPKVRPGSLSVPRPEVSPLSELTTPAGEAQPIEETPPSAPMPSELTINVVGRNSVQRGASYEQAIRDNYGSGKPTPAYSKGVGRPDDIKDDVAIEVKYTDDFESSPYNPNSNMRYSHNAIEDMVEQARRYSEGFKGGVTYYTNSKELAVTYDDLFRKNGISKFNFVVVPSKR